MRYYEVSGEWSMLVAVDVPKTEERDEAAEQAAMAYFADEFPMKEFFRGLETSEGQYEPEDYDTTIRPLGDTGNYEWVDDEEVGEN